MRKLHMSFNAWIDTLPVMGKMIVPTVMFIVLMIPSLILRNEIFNNVWTLCVVLFIYYERDAYLKKRSKS